MKARSKSIPILNFQKSLTTETDSHSNRKFKPFVNQRNLGKLIKQGEENKKKKMSIQDINFKNFKAIYRKQAILEEARYSRLTRNSEQRDLLSQNGWMPKKTNLVNNCRSDEKNKMERNCCSTHKLPSMSTRNNYDKMDEHIYKKIALQRPNFDMKPELQTLFRHYVETCELNENIRRHELTRKVKY